MAADKDYLRQLAMAIRDEYRKGANTAYRVGSFAILITDGYRQLSQIIFIRCHNQSLKTCSQSASENGSSVLMNNTYPYNPASLK